MRIDEDWRLLLISSRWLPLTPLENCGMSVWVIWKTFLLLAYCFLTPFYNNKRDNSNKCKKFICKFHSLWIRIHRQFQVLKDTTKYVYDRKSMTQTVAVHAIPLPHHNPLMTWMVLSYRLAAGSSRFLPSSNTTNWLDAIVQIS